MYVRAENFQSIRDVEFEIEGLTAIVGPSNIGKSSLWRTLFYPFHAKLGNSFVRHGEDFARVTIIDEDFRMVWEKGANVNRYFFGDDPEAVPKIKKGDIPQQILDAGFGDILLKNPEGKIKNRVSAQFAPQLGGNVFLLDSSPQMVAEVLAQLSRLDVLMKATRSTELDLRRVKTLLKVRREDERRLQDKADSFLGFSTVSQRIESLKGEAVSLRKDREIRDRVRTLSEKLAVCKGDLVRLSPLGATSVPDLPAESALSQWAQASGVVFKYRKVARILVSLAQLPQVEIPELGDPSVWGRASKVASFLRVCRTTKGMDLPEIPELPEIEKLSKVWHFRERQGMLAHEMADHHASLANVDLDLHSNEVLLEGIKSELKVCPTCERPFDDNH